MTKLKGSEVIYLVHDEEADSVYIKATLKKAKKLQAKIGQGYVTEGCCDLPEYANVFVKTVNIMELPNAK